jgi:FkbM family methyltransferase
MILKKLELFKYKLVRFIESHPSLNLLIYNNIRFFKFLLPHEKDFYGMLLVCANDKESVILDVGGNLGISSLGFRQLGFKNKIIIFEPNFYLYKYFLKKINKKDKSILIKNFALGNKNENKFFFMPYYKSKFIHYFSSFDKEYILRSIKLTFPKIFRQFVIKKKLIKCTTFDSLKLKDKIHFVKIDTEGFDEFVIAGLKKTIKKDKPIFLVEYNREYFSSILSQLKNYKSFVYDIHKNKMVKLSKNIIKNSVARVSKTNLLSVRNIYFIPNDYKFKC